MRVLLINSVCGIRSTGRICTDIARDFEKDGHEVKIAYGREEVLEQYQKYAVRIESKLGTYTSGIQSRLLGGHGLANKSSTKRFLEWADEYNPDLLWIHNIHGYYINYEMLFDWIKSRPDMKVKWTLHDCWAFTGHCSHFTMVKCDSWKTHCENCPQYKSYPTSIFKDDSWSNFEHKYDAFTGVENMTLITPSKWLEGLVKQSFLKDYPVEVVYNTIDTNIFKPTPSNFRQKYGLEDKIVILGVASIWNETKGLNDFILLSEMLNEKYKIVLVGLSKKQINNLPKKIIGIQHTTDAVQLAEIYTVADVFVNPTYEDNYPTTNLEAQACGTPCITYNTGGSPESVPKENVVVTGEIEKLYSCITRII